ncbi:MAG: formate hydrogenlyase, partial [Peptococcaceae bacterium]|nr:formate hydrogenlyase [Peptococcaceae bacterium]
LGDLGVESAWWGSVVLFIGILSALLGVAYALMEHNIKRLLAFHSVENIGIILIGLGVSFMALAGGHQVLGGLALTAALLHTFNHALFKGGLFLGAGSMQYATGTKDIEKLGGLIRRMPVTACLVLCFSLAISALVPFNGFISEWLTYQALLTHILSEPAGMSLLSILAVAALGMTGALAAACFVKLFGISFLGLPRSSAAEQAREVPWTMGLGMGILAVLCLGIGLYPWGAVRLLDPVITGMLGSSTLGTLSGNLVLLVDRSALAGASAQSVSLLSPLIFLGILTAMIIISLMMIRIFGGRYIERRYGTWDCGFEALNARMQYSATGFSKPLRIVFRMLFRPSRLTTVEGNTYHPDAIHYSVSVISLFEEYMYHPLIRLSKRLSKSAKFHVQTGNIHTYLLYIFLAIIVLMLYYRLMPS